MGKFIPSVQFTISTSQFIDLNSNGFEVSVTDKYTPTQRKEIEEEYQVLSKEVNENNLDNYVSYQEVCEQMEELEYRDVVIRDSDGEIAELEEIRKDIYTLRIRLLKQNEGFIRKMTEALIT